MHYTANDSFFRLKFGHILLFQALWNLILLSTEETDYQLYSHSSCSSNSICNTKYSYICFEFSSILLIRVMIAYSI